MLVNLDTLRKTLSETPAEETVDSSGVNTYLLNEVLRPILAGKELCYGDIDYSKFDADDVRYISDYCDEYERVSDKLCGFLRGIVKAEASACRNRAFC